MNQRQLDLALLAGIGVLLLVILMLALSAAPLSDTGDISDPAQRVVASSEPATEVQTDEPPAALEETPAVQNEPVSEEPVLTPAVEPAPDAVSIARIGFAYATGAAGACGVQLTPWNYVAVSRDLLTTYPCGTAVTLILEDEVSGRTEVVAQVGDTMGADITDTVNIFVGEDEPALEYGVTSGTLSP